FILEARPGSRIYAGLQPGVGAAEFRVALAKGKATECLHQLEPHAGDFLYLPAGTVHAIGGAVLFAQIQQTSDATFRLDEWDRRDSEGRQRPLHIDQGLAAIHWDQGEKKPTRIEGFQLGDIAMRPEMRQALLRSTYFNLNFVRANDLVTVGGVDTLQVLMLFTGRADSDSGEKLTAGQDWLFPAAMQSLKLRPVPSIQGMLCTLP